MMNVARDPGVVDQDVQVAKGLNSEFHQILGGFESSKHLPGRQPLFRPRIRFRYYNVFGFLG